MFGHGERSPAPSTGTTADSPRREPFTDDSPAMLRIGLGDGIAPGDFTTEHRVARGGTTCWVGPNTVTPRRVGTTRRHARSRRPVRSPVATIAPASWHRHRHRCEPEPPLNNPLTGISTHDEVSPCLGGGMSPGSGRGVGQRRQQPIGDSNSMARGRSRPGRVRRQGTMPCSPRGTAAGRRGSQPSERRHRAASTGKCWPGSGAATENAECPQRLDIVGYPQPVPTGGSTRTTITLVSGPDFRWRARYPQPVRNSTE